MKMMYHVQITIPDLDIFALKLSLVSKILNIFIKVYNYKFYYISKVHKIPKSVQNSIDFSFSSCETAKRTVHLAIKLLQKTIQKIMPYTSILITCMETSNHCFFCIDALFFSAWNCLNTSHGKFLFETLKSNKIIISIFQ